MYLVQIFNQIHKVCLTYFCLHFGTEGVLKYALVFSGFAVLVLTIPIGC
jgi:hypothetical protein